MKTAPRDTPEHRTDDDLRPEYDFGAMKARPNRFTANDIDGGMAVVLDPDIASVFRSSHEVNDVLRALIRTMPRLREAS